MRQPDVTYLQERAALHAEMAQDFRDQGHKFLAELSQMQAAYCAASARAAYIMTVVKIARR